MKLKILHVFTAFFLAIGALLSTGARAQSEGLSPSDATDPSHLEYTPAEDKVILAEHDSKTKVAIRDSVSSHSRSLSASPAATKQKSSETKSASGKENDDDALSFNFLYYIIQKFKISDLVDE